MALDRARKDSLNRLAAAFGLGFLVMPDGRIRDVIVRNDRVVNPDDVPDNMT